MRIPKEVIDRILTMYELSKLRVRLAENRSEIENIWELGRYLYWLEKNKKLNIADLSKKLLNEERSWDFEVDRLTLIKDFYTVYKDLDVFNSLLATVEVYKHEIILYRCKTNIERIYYLDNIRTNIDGISSLGGSIKNHEFENIIYKELKDEIPISESLEFTSWFNNLSEENKPQIELIIRRHFDIKTDSELFGNDKRYARIT